MPRAFGYVRTGNTHEDDGSAVQQQLIREYFELLLKERGYEWGRLLRRCSNVTQPGAALPTRRSRAQFGAGSRRRRDLHQLGPMFNSARAVREIIERWNEQGIQLHTLEFGMDTSTPIGKEMLKIQVEIADLRRSNKSEQMRESIAYRKSIGRAG
jgi:hypothetical protein